MKQLLLKISFLFFLVILFTNCNNEPLEKDSYIKAIQERDGLNTVPLDHSLDFFAKLNSKTTNKNTKDKNDIDLNIDLSSLRQVDITNTNAKLNIADATTKFDNIETQILQIEINGEMQTVLFHQIPKKNNTSKGSSSKLSESSFTGSVFSTNLSGTVLSGFSFNNGNILGSFNFFTSSYSTDPNPCWGITCGITLDEVILISNAPSTSNWAYTNYANTANVMLNYQFVRSTNNYSTMGIAYADYYRSLEIDKWIKNILEDNTPKINDISKELKCFDKTKTAKLTIYVEQAVEYSREVTARLGHTFIGIEQGGVIRNLGFYPDNGGAANLISSQDSEIHDNSQSPYHVSITIPVSANQLNNIINYIENYPNRYDLNNFNCSDFGIEVAARGGLILPKTNGSFSMFFEGRNPGDLGEDMRKLLLPAVATRNINGGNAPVRAKDCQ
ncbi:hypothetical protein [Yeosuana sp. AK3]